MRKVFHFPSPIGNYEADAAVLWCFDSRFHLSFGKFLKRMNASHLDHIKVAGGAKTLASPDNEQEREFVLEQIRKSMRLHLTQKVILMVHSDCGAYGSLAAFGDDVDRESVHHQNELRRAADVLRERLPSLDIEAYFVDFEGVWQVDVAHTLDPRAAVADTSGIH